MGAAFERDRFSGLKGRTLGLAGVTYLFANRKDFTLKTGLAATIAHPSEVVDDPTTKDTFAGVRLSAHAERKLGASTTCVGGLAWTRTCRTRRTCASGLRMPSPWR